MSVGDIDTAMRRCQKCGKPTMHEEALVNGQIWCHPCADADAVEKRNAFYNSDEYRNMTTAEKCACQGDGFINDYD